MWRTTIQLEKNITLYLQNWGHTKYTSDGALGLTKMKLKDCSAFTPSDIVGDINELSPTKRCFLTRVVRWPSWMYFLGKLYTLPSSFRVTNYHAFRYTAYDPHCTIPVVFYAFRWYGWWCDQSFAYFHCMWGHVVPSFSFCLWRCWKWQGMWLRLFQLLLQLLFWWWIVVGLFVFDGYNCVVNWEGCAIVTFVE